MDFFNVIGFIGTFLYVLSYFLLQTEKINQGKIYVFLNLIAAILVVVSLLKYWNAPSFTINVIWICLSLYGLYRLFNNQKDFDEVHIIFDYKTREEPEYFLFLKNKKKVGFTEFDDAKIWKIFDENYKIEFKKDTYFFNKIKIPLYQCQPPLRGQISGYANKIEIVDKDNCVKWCLTV